MNRAMDFSFARSLGEERRIDRIVMVADDLGDMVNIFTGTFDFTDFEMAETPDGKTAMVTLASGIELFLIRPEDNGSIYSRYFKKYGKGIMGIRERITLAQAVLWKNHIDKNAIPMTEEHNDCWWLDLTEDLGCMYGLYICEEEIKPTNYPKHIGQICIVAKDCEKAAEDLLHYIGKGPWEIGFINNESASYLSSSEYDAEHFPEGEMRTGMGWFSNLEFELIEPTKGPMPYYTYLERHGNGFQHMKEILTPETYEAELKKYSDRGIKTALAGKLGPCEFSNLDTLDLLGCVYEVCDGRIMDQLPEAYHPYMHPEAE